MKTLWRETWLEVVSVPLSAWMEENFRIIGELWSKVQPMENVNIHNKLLVAAEFRSSPLNVSSSKIASSMLAHKKCTNK